MLSCSTVTAYLHRPKIDDAYHEAGHAVVHCFLQVPFKKASIEKICGDYLGVIERRRLTQTFTQKTKIGELKPGDRDQIDRICETLLAGHLAERRLDGRHAPPGSHSDHSHVVGFLLGMYSSRATEAYVEFLRVRTEEILNAPKVWDAVRAVATVLMDKEMLSAKVVTAIYEEARSGAP